ncbi:reverse transcriptase [Gossypium australe]|uniref:Reverse transcriptase n=1 Tax=Gossypium australe TaxID=47621 RepID=A0A5B6WFQ2_9ROSI|nr:reverse transcriptase [Gossypium australe]
MLPEVARRVGFRDLLNFNIALLAKRYWRILKHPDCLLTKRYFLYTILESSKVGSYPFLTYRSILAARRLIERGMGLRIGTGSAVNIWNDFWIPGPGYDQLITSRHCTWKKDIVRAITDGDQISCILDIPLAKLKQTNTMVWKYEGTGDYIVNSGYKLLLLDKLRILDAYPNSMIQSNNPFYTTLWALQLPGKVKTIFWKF